MTAHSITTPLKDKLSKDNTIKILPESLANQIAAGEVVERPASIVKELIENAIDAKAKNITVIVQSGGKQYIKVMDDGVGMRKNDALLAFERHATSKIQTARDLHNIHTLGFRGEALPSIASVSHITLTTSKEENAVQIYLQGGQVKQVKDAAHPQGTSVEVCSLFFNTPARAKFLKSHTTELSHISKIFIQQGLAHSHISFKLQSGNKTIIDSPCASGELRYKIADLFGSELAKNLLEIKAETGNMNLYGYISRPDITRASRENQYLFVNNRYIKDRSLSHAITAAYSRVLPNNRHPVLFLYLSISPDAVDVNVHPSKTEVRFLEQGSIHDFVKNTLSNALYTQRSFTAPAGELSYENVYSGAPSENHQQVDRAARIQEAVENYISRPQAESTAPPSSLVSPSLTAQFRPIGQINNSFIVLEGKDGMLLIDQHTAHERVIYESLLKEVTHSSINIQYLLIPVKIECNAQESIILQNNIQNLERLGMEIEPFGPGTFILRSVPSLIVDNNYEKIIMDIVDTLSHYKKMGSFEDIMGKILATMACHAAISANQKLELKEMEHLINTLGHSNLPATCPHGRPIVLFFDIKEIKKRFKR